MMKKLHILPWFALLLCALLCACGPAMPLNADQNSVNNLDPYGGYVRPNNEAAAGGNANVGGNGGSGGSFGGNVAGQSRSASGGLAAQPKISLDEAKDAALRHAGVDAALVRFLKLALDHEDGRAQYELVFTLDDTVYSYTIDAANGRVLEFSQRLHRQRDKQSDGRI